MSRSSLLGRPHVSRVMAKTAATLLFGLSCSVCACGRGSAGGASYRLAMAEATRAQTAGRFFEAGRSYERASALASTGRDRAYTRYLGGLMRIDAGDFEGALELLDEVAQLAPPMDASAEAMYRAALVRIGHGAAKTGYAQLEALMQAFPSHGVTRSAVRKLLARAEELGGSDAALAWLRAQGVALGHPELGQVLRYQEAQYLERMAATQGERRHVEQTYLKLADDYPYPKGVHFDDALVRAARLAAKDERGLVAIGYLTRLLRERENAHLMGTYERPLYGPAQMQIAIIYEEVLRDLASARDAWHRLYVDFPTSTARDDALFREAQLWKASGDRLRSCSTLMTLARELPHSRYAACAPVVCSDSSGFIPAAPGPKSRGSATHPNTAICHPYVLAAWESGSRIPTPERASFVEP
jgi:tetratricopeptide (TPR) repeat protein